MKDVLHPQVFQYSCLMKAALTGTLFIQFTPKFPWFIFIIRDSDVVLLIFLYIGWCNSIIMSWGYKGTASLILVTPAAGSTQPP